MSRDALLTPGGTPYMGIEPRGLWFLSVRMKKQELSHIYVCLWFLSVRMEKQELSHFDEGFESNGYRSQ